MTLRTPKSSQNKNVIPGNTVNWSYDWTDIKISLDRLGNHDRTDSYWLALSVSADHIHKDLQGFLQVLWLDLWKNCNQYQLRRFSVWNSITPKTVCMIRMVWIPSRFIKERFYNIPHCKVTPIDLEPDYQSDLVNSQSQHKNGRFSIIVKLIYWVQINYNLITIGSKNIIN